MTERRRWIPLVMLLAVATFWLGFAVCFDFKMCHRPQPESLQERWLSRYSRDGLLFLGLLAADLLVGWKLFRRRSS